MALNLNSPVVVDGEVSSSKKTARAVAVNLPTPIAAAPARAD
ncbi:hypothetical protein NKH18_51080 [Streptomyces sp. M10(2022)]